MDHGAGAETIFERFFWPLYPEDVRRDLGRARATDANPGGNPAIAAELEDAARVFARRFDLDGTDASVHRLSALVTPAQCEAWGAEGGAPGTPENELFNVIVHGVAYVGECARKGGARPRDARWSVRRPLWESLVTLESRAGTGALAVFQWWLKAAAGAGTLADRYRAHVEVPTSRPEDELSPIVAGERRLPRIAKSVRYDVLHKHLKAHLPELSDLGADFPSPERFAEMRFRWLDFLLLGGARELLVFGPGEGGLHLFWVSARGFEKATFVPCDAFPEPIVRADGERVVVVVSHEGKPAAHEWLWWGP